MGRSEHYIWAHHHSASLIYKVEAAAAVDEHLAHGAIRIVIPY